MNDLSKKVYNQLIKNGIKEEDIIECLNGIIDDINLSKYETIEIQTELFYNLRNDIFFNYEFLNMEFDKEFSGVSNISNFGKVFNNFMFNIFDTATFKEDLTKLLDELLLISKNLDNFKYDVRIFAEQNFDWTIDGENSSKMIVYKNKYESPRKYGYTSSGRKYTGIFDDNGNQIVLEDNYILCAVDEIDRIRLLQSFKGCIDIIISKIKKAEKYNKIVKFSFVDSNSFT